VKELTAQGHSARDIARRLGINRKVVLCYRRLEECPDWNPGRTAATGLDSHAEFVAEWLTAVNRNIADLYRLLKARGYSGSGSSTAESEAPANPVLAIRKPSLPVKHLHRRGSCPSQS
jgi:hypothetical protein